MDYVIWRSGGDAGVSEWRAEAGDTGRWDSYGGEFFLFKCSRRSWREANWLRAKCGLVKLLYEITDNLFDVSSGHVMPPYGYKIAICM